jgi:hypothetical protein
MLDPNRAQDPIPPRWAQRLLEVALPERDRLAIPGDLSEEFAQRMASQGRQRARRWYRLQNRSARGLERGRIAPPSLGAYHGAVE